MGWLAKQLGVEARPKAPVISPITERDPAVAALVERCRRITAEESLLLTGEWVGVEEDATACAHIAAGIRAAGLDARAAADAADWAFRWTLPGRGESALYVANDPFAGRAINAIRAHGTAVAARETLSPELAALMSGPWLRAMGSD